MKKLLLLITVLTFSGFVSAQEKANNQIEFSTNYEQWSKAVGLTEAQKAEVVKIDADTKEKRAAIRSTGTGKDFQKINQERDAKILGLLTPEQKSKDAAYNAKKQEEKTKKISSEKKSK